ncbi:MAG: tyrosine-type recombinase/integrase [Acetatifactor sp.]|nr:tyrosine-type recombinase/integrase [Acetatifactor sp.]
MTLCEIFDNFILSRQLAGLSLKTVSDYRQFVTPFVRAVGSGKAFEEVSQADIQAYLSDLLKRPLSRSSRATYIRHVKIFLCWAEREYTASYTTSSLKVPRSPKRNVRIYSDAEVKQIFAAVHTETEWLTLRNKCIVALMYDSGLRQSEVCTLRRCNVSYSENRMTVRGKGDKERTVPLGQLTRRFMQEYTALCPYSGDMVFLNRRGNPLTCNAVKLFVSRLADSLPFELSSHKLRHNFATNYCIDQYEKNGQVDIYRLMYLMGHEEIGTTRRYLHMANEILASRGCISHLDGILNGEI